MDLDEINILFLENENENNLLSLLPYDLKRDIYEKYFYPNRLVLDLLEELQSNYCQRLDIIHLLPILRNVLEDKLAIDYLLKEYEYIYPGVPPPYYKQNIFKNLYNDIIINKRKYFILLKDPIEDFALSWVHFMYK
jgi:hypothetical protein